MLTKSWHIYEPDFKFIGALSHEREAHHSFSFATCACASLALIPSFLDCHGSYTAWPSHEREAPDSFPHSVLLSTTSKHKSRRSWLTVFPSIADITSLFTGRLFYFPRSSSFSPASTPNLYPDSGAINPPPTLSPCHVSPTLPCTYRPSTVCHYYRSHILPLLHSAAFLTFGR
jgi:hypothetical protein